MSWLTPLGFLGFIGLIALIIIYIIKPNYQNKIISSTYIWKLSLKLRKKKIPISKLRNIILFICQILAISTMALILAQPFIAAEKEEEVTEKVMIIDASASMLSETDGITRFETSVDKVRTLANETFDQNGKITVILAGDKASYVVQEIGAEYRTTAIDAIDQLVDPSQPFPVTYGEGDIEGAIVLAEEITAARPDVEVLLYTDTNYIDDGKVTVVDVKDPTEWNAAILDVRAILDENYYRFEIDVACYGAERDVRVNCDIYGVNGENTVNLSSDVRCHDGEVVTLVYANYNPEKPDESITDDVEAFSFDYVSVTISEFDSFDHDNVFYLYGGKKLPLRVQYYSSNPNNYFATALMVLRDSLSNRWDIDYVEVNGSIPENVPATEGFDVYIYEHKIPKTLPTDGIIILSNPDTVPSSLGLRLGKTGGTGSNLISLEKGDSHPLIDDIDASRIEVSLYNEISSYDGYEPLMYCENAPVIMAKNEPDQKVVVMSFSLNYSNLALLPEFPLFMNNIFEYFAPSTVTEYVFEINESITMNARSEALTVIGPSTEVEITEFPGTIDLTKPGVYTVSQTILSGNDQIENFYVKIPAAESNTCPTVDTLTNPYFLEVEENEDLDLLFYFALALVILLFAEWWLQSREQF